LRATKSAYFGGGLKPLALSGRPEGSGILGKERSPLGLRGRDKSLLPSAFCPLPFLLIWARARGS